MDQSPEHTPRFKHPEFWLIASVILVLPPTYFWLFGLLRAVGFDVMIAADMLKHLPDYVGVILVFVLPFLALATSVVSRWLMHNAFTTLLLSLSALLSVATILTAIF